MTKMGKKEQMVFMMRFGEKKTRRRNSLGKLRGGDITWNHWAPGWEGGDGNEKVVEEGELWRKTSLGWKQRGFMKREFRTNT